MGQLVICPFFKKSARRLECPLSMFVLRCILEKKDLLAQYFQTISPEPHLFDLYINSPPEWKKDDGNGEVPLTCMSWALSGWY